MAKGCKKCDPHDLCEECPEWIFTLADLIMCMMGLFVILWVLKPDGGKGAPQTKAQEEKLVETIVAIRQAFGYVPSPNSDDPIDMHMLVKQLERLKLNGPGEKGQTEKQSQGAQGTDPEVTAIRHGKQTAVGTPAPFERGRAELTPDGTANLRQVADKIRGHRNVVLIKGHTAPDDLPEGTAPGAKMDLSIRRAQAAADFLVAQGVSPDILRVTGCSVFEPVAQRAYTPAAQAANRRVEVQSTETLVEALQDPPAGTPTTLTTPPHPAPPTPVHSHP